MADKILAAVTNSNSEKLLLAREASYTGSVDFYSTTELSSLTGDSYTVQGVTIYASATAGEAFSYIYNGYVYSMWYTLTTGKFAPIQGSAVGDARYLIEQGVSAGLICTYGTSSSASFKKKKQLIQFGSTIFRLKDAFEFTDKTDCGLSLTTTHDISSIQGHYIYIKLKWPKVYANLPDTYHLYFEYYPSVMSGSSATLSTYKTKSDIDAGIATIKIDVAGVVSELYLSGYITDDSGNKYADGLSWFYDVTKDTALHPYVNGTLLKYNSSSSIVQYDIAPSETEPFALLANGASYFNIYASNNSYSSIQCLSSNISLKSPAWIFANTTFTNLKGTVSVSYSQLVDLEYQVQGLYYATNSVPTTNPITYTDYDRQVYMDSVTAIDGTGKFRITLNSGGYLFKIPLGGANVGQFITLYYYQIQSGSSTYMTHLRVVNNSNFKVYPSGSINLGGYYYNLQVWFSNGVEARTTLNSSVYQTLTTASPTVKTNSDIYWYINSTKTISGGRISSGTTISKAS